MTLPDFSQLYAQLDLGPNFSLEEFKRAYRRRVAELHPDRLGETPQAGDAGDLSLSELTSLYGLAMQFRKQHGRLPGQPLPSMRVRVAPDAMPGRAQQRSIAAPGDGQGFANVSRRSWLLLLVLLAAVAWLIFSGFPAASPAD